MCHAEPVRSHLTSDALCVLPVLSCHGVTIRPPAGCLTGTRVDIDGGRSRESAGYESAFVLMWQARCGGSSSHTGRTWVRTGKPGGLGFSSPRAV